MSTRHEAYQTAIDCLQALQKSDFDQSVEVEVFSWSHKGKTIWLSKTPVVKGVFEPELTNSQG